MSAAKPLSIRMPTATARRLNAHCKATGETKTALIQRYVEEGLRMEKHPGIIFVDGPAGRRPSLIDGPDVWEEAVVYRVHRNKQDALATTCKLTGLREDQARAVADYYEEFSDEVDAWIARNEELAEKLQVRWLREQDRD